MNMPTGKEQVASSSFQGQEALVISTAQCCDPIVMTLTKMGDILS